MVLLLSKLSHELFGASRGGRPDQVLSKGGSQPAKKEKKKVGEERRRGKKKVSTLCRSVRCSMVLTLKKLD
ncbi:unnamed protein product [Victoria cruziana]